MSRLLGIEANRAVDLRVASCRQSTLSVGAPPNGAADAVGTHGCEGCIEVTFCPLETLRLDRACSQFCLVRCDLVKLRRPAPETSRYTYGF